MFIEVASTPKNFVLKRKKDQLVIVIRFFSFQLFTVKFRKELRIKLESGKDSGLRFDGMFFPRILVYLKKKSNNFSVKWKRPVYMLLITRGGGIERRLVIERLLV